MTATSVEVARQLADSLEQAGLSCAIGGALALEGFSQIIQAMGLLWHFTLTPAIPSDPCDP